MLIPIDLTRTLEPLPVAVYTILCEGVALLDEAGNDTFLDDKIAVISLKIKIISDDPALNGCRKRIQHRLNIPLSTDSADLKDMKIFFAKKTCEGFGVEFTEEGFDPGEFVNKTTQAIIVQNADKSGSGQIYNNIKSFVVE